MQRRGRRRGVDDGDADTFAVQALQRRAQFGRFDPDNPWGRRGAAAAPEGKGAGAADFDQDRRSSRHPRGFACHMAAKQALAHTGVFRHERDDAHGSAPGSTGLPCNTLPSRLIKTPPA